ncbi:MAG: hypothetical protein V3V41_08030 [Candidatus Heimdallarchaeota archaeon]
MTITISKRNKNKAMIIELISNNPGISATTSVIENLLPGFEKTYRPGPSCDKEIYHMLRTLKQKGIIYEEKGRLYCV